MRIEDLVHPVNIDDTSPSSSASSHDGLTTPTSSAPSPMKIESLLSHSPSSATFQSHTHHPHTRSKSTSAVGSHDDFDSIHSVLDQHGQALMTLLEDVRTDRDKLIHQSALLKSHLDLLVEGLRSTNLRDPPGKASRPPSRQHLQAQEKLATESVPIADFDADLISPTDSTAETARPSLDSRISSLLVPLQTLTSQKPGDARALSVPNPLSPKSSFSFYNAKQASAPVELPAPNSKNSEKERLPSISDLPFTTPTSPLRPSQPKLSAILERETQEDKEGKIDLDVGSTLESVSNTNTSDPSTTKVDSPHLPSFSGKDAENRIVQLLNTLELDG